MTAPRLVIIDGYSLLFRAFYAMPDLSLPTGEPTGALYGFLTMLLKLLEEQKPDAFVVAFDAPAATFRHEQFESYKAHRPDMPEALLAQVEPVKEAVSAFNIPILEISGVEADDVVGTVARRGAAEGYEVVIVTGDMDCLQLVSDRDRIRVMMNRRGITDTVLYDEAAVQERFGIRPDQVADFKALKGDPSDNIPGLPGIGDKTAARLLQQFGSVENLLEHQEEVKDAKVLKILQEHGEKAIQYKALTHLITDVGIELPIERWKMQPPDTERLRQIFERWQFRSLINRLPAPAPLLTQPPPQAALQPEVIPILSGAEWDRIAARLREARHIALRVQAEDDALKIALASGPQEAHWCILRGKSRTQEQLSLMDYDVPQEQELQAEGLRTILEDPAIAKFAHDAKSEWHKLRSFRIGLEGVVFDTMLADYLLNPSRAQHPLSQVAEDYLNARIEGQPFGEEGALGHEAAAIAALVSPMRERLDREGMRYVLEEIEMPLWPVLAQMETEGVRVDVGWLHELSKSLQVQIERIQSEIYALAGEEFNISSTKQLQTILFEKLKLPAGKKTKTGYSTGADLLEALAPSHEIAAKILEYRELTKLKSTYADALPKLVNPRTGRIHTHLNQAVTATGRLSSSEPNLQNIPIRTEVGREIRKAFIAGPGCRLLSADYSQIELRVLAHISGDQTLREAFRNDEDIHAFTAKGIFHVEDAGVTPELRRRAKTINFGIIYGMSDFRLSNDIGVSVQEAKEYIQSYFQRYPGVQQYIDSIIAEARQKGYVQTLMGRKRPIPELHDRHHNIRQFGERAAINAPIQGTAADMIKLAMVRLYRKMQEKGLRSKMLLQVHDELVFEALEEEIGLLTRLAKETMEKAFPLEVPVKVDVKAGSNWAEMEKIL